MHPESLRIVRCYRKQRRTSKRKPAGSKTNRKHGQTELVFKQLKELVPGPKIGKSVCEDVVIGVDDKVDIVMKATRHIDELHQQLLRKFGAGVATADQSDMSRLTEHGVPSSITAPVQHTCEDSPAIARTAHDRMLQFLCAVNLCSHSQQCFPVTQREQNVPDDIC